MQSLLLPQLAGQIYAMAGMSTQLNFAADRPGVYLGENTQYNGEGFQAERFAVKALQPADYRLWVARVQQSAKPFDAAVYPQLAQRSIQAKPLFFSSVPPGLYAHILSLSSGRSQPQPERRR
jgi:cytochrome o ubiquinol oxidase subunit 2